MAVELNASNFDETIKEWVTLVDFWAPWCGPCQMMTPIIEELTKSMDGKATIAKVNVDDNQDLAMRFWIMWIPNIVIFKNSEIVWSESWVKDGAFLTSKINEFLD